MLIFKNFAEKIHYLFDILTTTSIYITISGFKMNRNENKLYVYYNLGRKKITLNMELNQFINKNFSHVSSYDKIKLIKYQTLQNTLTSLFTREMCLKETFLSYFEEEITNDQL